MSEKTKRTKTENFVLGLLAFLLAVLSSLFGSLVLAKGWEWFVADTFGIYAVSLIEAWGLSIVAHMLTFVYRRTDQDPDEDRVVTSFMTALAPSVYYAICMLMLFILVQFR